MYEDGRVGKNGFVQTSGEIVEITENWLTRAVNSGKLIPPATWHPKLGTTFVGRELVQISRCFSRPL